MGRNQYSGKSPRPVIVPIGPSIAYVQLSQGRFSLIDSHNAAEAGKSNWCAMRVGNGFYAYRRVPRNGSYRLEGLHTAILKPRAGFVTDHKNCNGLFNLVANLREATVRQNSTNTRRKSKSVLKGAWMRRGKWISVITIDGKKVSLGTFQTAEDAHRAYCKAAAEAFGEFWRAA